MLFYHVPPPGTTGNFHGIFPLGPPPVDSRPARLYNGRRKRAVGGDGHGYSGTAEDDPAGLSRQGGVYRVSGGVRPALSLLPQRGTGAGPHAGRAGQRGAAGLSAQAPGPAGRGVRHGRGTPAPPGPAGAALSNQGAGLSGEAGHQRRPPRSAAGPGGGGSGGLCGHGREKQSRAVRGDGGGARPGPGPLPGERLLPAPGDGGL